MSITRHIRITVAGKVYDVTAELLDDAPGSPHTAASEVSSAYRPAAPPSPGGGRVLCPISGIVVTIHVKEGQPVQKGDILVTIEAMKMNTPVWAPQDGVVASIHAQAGVPVEEGALLVELA